MAKKILVVDDREDDLETIKEILENKGYKVSTAMSGKNAINLLKKRKFDLITIDILMPKLSGYDLLRILRKKYNSKIPMIYVTIVPKKEVDLDGIDSFVQKPFSPNELIAEVKAAIKKYRK